MLLQKDTSCAVCPTRLRLPVVVQNVVNDLKQVVVTSRDPSDEEHLQEWRGRERETEIKSEVGLKKMVSAMCFYSVATNRGKLVVELRQHGVLHEDGRVPAEQLQLLLESLFVLLAAVPGGGRLEERLARRVAPLQNHDLQERSEERRCLSFSFFF